MARSDEAAHLSKEARFELEIVVAGARADLGDVEAALVHLERLEGQGDARRIDEARAVLLRGAGRTAEANAIEEQLEASAPDEVEPEEDVVLYDVAELPDPTVEPEPEPEPEPAPAEHGSTADGSATPDSRTDQA